MSIGRHHFSPILTYSKIPKPNDTEGLGIQWPAKETDKDALSKLYEEIKSKM
jgi:hypothetical protein